MTKCTKKTIVSSILNIKNKDIIITDPCYIIRDNNDWDKCDYGDNMEALGLIHFLVSSTLYGDWSCTTFDYEDNPLGRFCADSGQVAVFLLDEVLKYNPDFDYHITKPWTTTLIKNFTGNIWIERRHIEGEYDKDTFNYKKGDKWEDDVISVVGEGNVNFHTIQTGV